MCTTKLEVLDKIEEQKNKLQYIAELEDKPGLSNILLEIASELSLIKYAKCFEGIENVKED